MEGGVKEFYSRRLKRLGIPLLVWNTLYMIRYFILFYRQGGEEVETILKCRKICVIRL